VCDSEARVDPTNPSQLNTWSWQLTTDNGLLAYEQAHSKKLGEQAAAEAFSSVSEDEEQGAYARGFKAGFAQSKIHEGLMKLVRACAAYIYIL